MIHFGKHKIERNDPCWCGSGRKYKSCHMRFDEKLRQFQLSGAIVPDHSILKTPAQVDGIRKSAEINMACLDAVTKEIGAGMPTEDIAWGYEIYTRAKAMGLGTALKLWDSPHWS